MRIIAAVVVLSFLCAGSDFATATPDLVSNPTPDATLLPTKCPHKQIVQIRLTPDGSALPKDGGVLVGWQWSSEEKRVDRVPPVFRDGAKTVEMRSETIAPGVVVYHPRKHSGRLSLVGTHEEFSLGGAPQKTKADAPLVAAVHKLIDQGTSGGSHVSVDVELTQPPLDGSVGLIMYRTEKKGSVAISFEPLEGQSSSIIEVYSDPGPCATGLPGVHPPSIGEKVSFAWVDLFGRVSDRSNEVAVSE